MFWVITLIILAIILLAVTSGPDAKAPDTLEKAVDKIFNQLESEARTWGRNEAVAPLNEAKSKIQKLLKDRKLV